MGAQSDAISEQFVPSEHHKAQQRAMAEALSAVGLPSLEFGSQSTSKDDSHVPTEKALPLLIAYQGAQRCSICKMPFPSEAKPSQEGAFAEHVRKAHRPGQTSEYLSYAAGRIARETTE
jgi:hypothetical protein